jgi:hypothetical protein
VKTLVIANDRRTAESIMRFYALRETPHPAHDQRRFPGYGFVAATQAYPALLATRPDRIIIGGDYLRWYFGPEPGRLTNLWRVITAARARGTQVVFN